MALKLKTQNHPHQNDLRPLVKLALVPLKGKDYYMAKRIYNITQENLIRLLSRLSDASEYVSDIQEDMGLIEMACRTEETHENRLLLLKHFRNSAKSWLSEVASLLTLIDGQLPDLDSDQKD